MAYTNCCTGIDRTSSKVLVNTAYINHTGNGRIIQKRNLALRRKKNNFSDWVIEMFGYCERLHILDPAPSTCMDRVANLILTLQDKRTYTLLRSSLSGS